eukprot:scaffold2205_cov167-Amphora_coffeaeformis.AAC.7
MQNEKGHQVDILSNEVRGDEASHKNDPSHKTIHPQDSFLRVEIYLKDHVFHICCYAFCRGTSVTFTSQSKFLFCVQCSAAVGLYLFIPYMNHCRIKSHLHFPRVHEDLRILGMKAKLMGSMMRNKRKKASKSSKTMTKKKKDMFVQESEPTPEPVSAVALAMFQTNHPFFAEDIPTHVLDAIERDSPNGLLSGSVDFLGQTDGSIGAPFFELSADSL